MNVTAVNGTVILCDTVSDASGPLLSGAVGVVMQGVNTDYAFSFPLSATVLGSLDSGNVSLYINTTRCIQLFLLHQVTNTTEVIESYLHISYICLREKKKTKDITPTGF